MLNIDIGGRKNKFLPDDTWEIMDIIPKEKYVVDLNSCDRFPLEDNSIDNYYTSHTLEHVKPKRILFVFQEIYRTLKPGGTVRIVVPDFCIGAKWYLQKDKQLLNEKGIHGPDWYPPTLLGRLLAWMKTPDEFVYAKDRTEERLFRSGHAMVFDYETLVYYLTKAKFTGIFKLSCDVCSYVFLGKDIERYKDYSLYVEATK